VPGKTKQLSATPPETLDPVIKKRRALAKKPKTELIDMLLEQQAELDSVSATATELARIYAALDSIPDAIAVFDPEDRFVFTNKAYLEINAEVRKSFKIGSAFEAHLKELLKKGLLPAADGRESAWLKERLERHRNPQGPVDHVRRDGTILRIAENKLSDGSTAMVMVNVSALRRADKALAESEYARTLLLSAIDEITEGIALFDAEDRLVLANKSWRHMNSAVAGVTKPGTSFEDHLWNCIKAGLIPEAAGNEEQWVARRMALHKNPQQPFEVNRLDGRVNLVHEQVVTDGGRILVILNITEQKRLQNRLENAIESINDAFILYDAEGRLVLCNSKFKEFYPQLVPQLVPGATFESLFRESIGQGVHSGEAVGDEDYIQSRLKDFFTGEGVNERQLSDGRWVLISDRKTQSGEIVGIRTDISELKRREKESVLAEQTLLDAIESISEGFILFDAESRMLMCNSKYKEYYASLSDLLKPGVAYADILQAAIERNAVVVDETERDDWTSQRAMQFEVAEGSHQQQMADGRWMQLSERRTKTGGMVGIRRDITDIVNAEYESRRAVERAEQANTAKSEFLGNMSHELRTPLNAIIGFSSVISKQLYGPVRNATYLDYAGDIQRSGEHLLKLIGDLLDISRIEAGELTINKSPLDIGRAIRDCIRMVDGQCREKQISLRRAVPAGLPSIFADARHFNQILINILSNAVKFTPVEGRITIAAKQQDANHVSIVISDTGVGIEAHNLALVLEPFGQVADAITRNHDGVGLGLAIVKSLVELHGGELRLTSKVGQGTAVEIIMPIDGS